MNSLAVILLSTALATTTSVLVAPWVNGATTSTAPVEAIPTDTEALARRLDAIDAALATLTTRVVELETARTRIDVPSSTAAVDGAAQGSHGGVSPSAGSVDGEPEFDAAIVFDELRRPSLSWEQRQEVWAGRSAKEQDAILAHYERLASANPQSSELQNELGEAYVHRLLNADFMGMVKYGQLAEKQFDRALELDDHHWAARFNKAMSLSNQPAFLGRQPEAIAHFRTLLEQQEAVAPETRHAQTYLFLGNLYAQTGQADEARAMWERGLARFPDSAELRSRLGR